MLVEKEDKIAGATRPLRFSVSMWRDARSLCHVAFFFFMGGMLISLGFPIHSRISVFQANSFGLAIWMGAVY